MIDLRKIYRTKDLAWHGFVYLSLGTATEKHESRGIKIPKVSGDCFRTKRADLAVDETPVQCLIRRQDQDWLLLGGSAR